MIFNPICDIDKLQNRYNAIEYYLKKNDVSVLSNIKDIEKMITKIKISKSTPFDYAALYHTLSCVSKLSLSFKKDNKLFQSINIDPKKLVTSIQSTQKILDDFFNISICEGIPNMSFEKFPEINHNIINKSNLRN